MSRFAIYDQRGNSTGMYYTLTTRTDGTLGSTATITVKHSSRYDTFACLTCNLTTCKHAEWVQEYVTNEKNAQIDAAYQQHATDGRSAA